MEIYEKIPLPLPLLLLLLLLLIKIIVKIILIFVSLLLTLSLECQHDSVQRGEESSSLQYSTKYGIVLLPDSFFFFFVINPEINKNVHITIKNMKTRFLQLTRDIHFQVTSIIQDPPLSPRTFDKIDVKALGRAISPLSVIF